MDVDLRCQSDRDLADELLKEPDVKRVLEILERREKEAGTRRQLLGTAMRLTKEMAPDVHDIISHCRSALGIETPLEVYVYPGPVFNAAAVKPERGRMFMMLSASLLEAFEPNELSFVVGHELGHHLYEHHSIPVGLLLGGRSRIRADLALRLFAWQRFAEISADRTGVHCAGGLEPAALALFKLASGLSGGRVHVDVGAFLAQVGDLEKEAGLMAGSDEDVRTDWFATHPFSPLRLKAAEMFQQSVLMKEGGTSRDELELQVNDLMLLMQPSYLKERSDVAETMRRLLLAGGVAIAHAAGAPDDETNRAIEKLLGPGALAPDLDLEALKQDLPARIEAVKQSVPRLRRMQVLRDLCVIARADGRIDDQEREVLSRIAQETGIGDELVSGALDPCQECLTS